MKNFLEFIAEAHAKVWHLANKKFNLISDKDGYTLVTQGSGKEKKLKAKTPADATRELVKKGYRESVEKNVAVTPYTLLKNMCEEKKVGDTVTVKGKKGKIVHITKGALKGKIAFVKFPGSKFTPDQIPLADL